MRGTTLIRPLPGVRSPSVAKSVPKARTRTDLREEICAALGKTPRVLRDSWENAEDASQNERGTNTPTWEEVEFIREKGSHGQNI